MIRRDGEHILRKVLRADIQGKRQDDRIYKMERPDLKSTGLRAGEEMDMATWSRKIISRTGDHNMMGKARRKEKDVH